MTDDGFDGVDLDRLADYLGGALTGTPDEDAVARLVAADPAWAAAGAALHEADLAVRAELDTLPPVGPVPDDVVAMLDHALAGMTPAGMTLAAPARSDRPVVVPRQPDRAVVVPLRRRLRTTALVGAAAAVVGAVAVLGLDHLPFSATESADRATVGGAAPRAASVAPAQVLVSGLDYTAGTVAGLLRPRSAGLAPDGSPDPLGQRVPDKSSPSANGPQGQPNVGVPGSKAAGGVPAELAVLYAQAGRDACLHAVTRLYGGTVTLVDYARFNGAPSLVLALSSTDPDASGRIVVVGPQCGEAGTVTDERYSTLVR